MIVGRRRRSTSATSRTSCPTCCASGSTLTPILYYASEVPERYQWVLDVNPIGQLLRARGATCSTLGIAPPAGGSPSGAAWAFGALHRRRRCSSSPGSVISLSVSDRPQHLGRGRLGHVPHVVREAADAHRARCMRLGRRERIVREIEALKDVSFEVEHGKVLGVVGANGAGKSTLVRTIAGILPPTSGASRCTAASARCSRSASASTATLTGRENVVLGGLAAGPDARAAGREVRGDRRVRRARGLHGHADADLLVGHVRPPRLLRGGEHGPGHPADRRGAVGRRRALPQEVLREDARALRRRTARSCSSATRSARSRSSATRRSGCTRASCACGTSPTRSSTPTRSSSTWDDAVTLEDV